MAKSRDAFRTISEVSEKLDTPAHVLRFWESKFRQIKPVKRAGGRRYYRPDDVALLGGIKTLLHDEGMTIKGAQKLLREKGVKHVIAIAEDGLPEPVEQPALVDVTPAEPAQVVEAVPEPAKVSAPPAAGQVQMPPPVAATPRFFDGFDVAARQSLRANAAQVAPLLTRLEKVSARMRVG